MIQALYFDGRSARAWTVELSVDAGCLVAVAGVPERSEPAPGCGSLRPGDPPLRWPLARVRWPERTRHGQRVLHLPGGAALQVADAAAFDAWRRGVGPVDGWVVRVQQNWRATLVAVLLLVGGLAAGYRWGLPWLTQSLLGAVPAAVDREVGEAALRSLEGHWLQPSGLPAARQAALRASFASAVAQAYPDGSAPTYRLMFFDAGPAIGPNAFALPGGSIVVTDALVQLLHDRDDTLVGVLGHELGHVRRRDGMQSVVRGALIGGGVALALGDFSSLAAGAPVWLAQLGYSRDAERAADAEAARLLRASGRSPAVMGVLFDRLAALPGRVAPPLALASHPLDDERVRFFENAASGAGSAR